MNISKDFKPNFTGHGNWDTDPLVYRSGNSIRNILPAWSHLWIRLESYKKLLNEYELTLGDVRVLEDKVQKLLQGDKL